MALFKPPTYAHAIRVTPPWWFSAALATEEAIGRALASILVRARTVATVERVEADEAGIVVHVSLPVGATIDTLATLRAALTAEQAAAPTNGAPVVVTPEQTANVQA